MAQHKNQHYVPEFYLKRFSPDADKKTICLWNLKGQQRITGASLSDQCSEDYFYGKDLKLEKSFIPLEGLTATLLNEIDRTDIVPPRCSEHHSLLLFYLTIQWTRTKHRAEAMNESFDKVMKEMYRPMAEQRGVDVNRFNIHMQEPVHLGIKIAADTFPLILDLHCKILANRTEKEYVTSDNPVVFYNQLFSFVRGQSNTGLNVKGLQIFFPISPSKVLLLYDAGVYSAGERSRSVVDVTKAEDVDQINLLQLCGCKDNVYFRDESTDLEELHRKALRFRKGTMSQVDSFVPAGDNDGSEKLIAMSFSDVMTDLNLSCVSITRRARRWRTRFWKKRWRPSVVIRNPSLSNEYDKYRSRLEKGEVDGLRLYQHLCAQNLSRKQVDPP